MSFAYHGWTDRNARRLFGRSPYGPRSPPELKMPNKSQVPSPYFPLRENLNRQTVNVAPDPNSGTPPHPPTPLLV